jgi:hypothetical protein
VATGLTAPFFMTWSDDSETRLYLADRDPANRVVAVDVTSTPASVTAVAPSVPFRPSSVAVTTADHLMVCCDTEVYDVVLTGSSYHARGGLLLGIGFVPFDRIDAGTGLATTDRGYFFEVRDAPFGGRLPLMINHPRAYMAGLQYYRVLVDGVVQRATWSDYLLDPSDHFALQAIGPVSGDYYAVRPPAETWMNPWLGFFVDSTPLPYGRHTITLELAGSPGGLAAERPSITVLVDNGYCVATLAAPVLSTTSGLMTASPDCGALTYHMGATGPEGTLTLAFTASQPHDHGTYSLGVLRGITDTRRGASGPVSEAPTHSPLTAPVADLLGPCGGGVAGFGAGLAVGTTTIDGWRRLSEYDASAQRAFALAPEGCGTPAGG